MEIKLVKPEDSAKYGDFCLHHLRNLASLRRPVPLYHYTTGESLIQIIESGSLWATQIACLNDATELTHAVELLQDAIVKRRKSTVTHEFAILLAKMDELLSVSSPEVAGIFVICFSERRDDLSQWRAYGGTEGGYAIESDYSKIQQAAAKKGALLVPVTYDGTAKDNLMADVMKWSEIYFMEGINDQRATTHEVWADEFARIWLWNLSWLAPILKHPSFRDEAEWRLIYFLKDEDVPHMRFSQRQSMLTRHIPLHFTEPDNCGNTKLPIANIMVGPTSHPRLSQMGVGDLMRTNGYADAVKITTTNIPFRTGR